MPTYKNGLLISPQTASSPIENAVAPDSKGKIGFAENLSRQPFHDRILNLIPFNPNTLIDTVLLKKAMHRLKEDDYTDDDKGAWQRAFDQKDVETYYTKVSEEASRGKTIGAKVWDVASNIPAWAYEFAVTGGLSTLGKLPKGVALGEYISKGIISKTGVTSKVGQTAIKGLSWGTAGGARTALQPLRVAESYYKRRLPQVSVTDKGKYIFEDVEDKPFTSAMKAVADVWIENATEESGEAMAGAGKIILKKLPFASEIVNRVAKTWVGKTAGRTFGQAYQQLATKAGFDGIIAEIGEERLADILHAVTKTDTFGHDSGANVFDRIMHSFPKPEQLAVEGIAFGLFGGGMAVAQQTKGYVENKIAEHIMDTPTYIDDNRNEIQPTRKYNVSRLDERDDTGRPVKSKMIGEEVIRQLKVNNIFKEVKPTDESVTEIDDERFSKKKLNTYLEEKHKEGWRPIPVRKLGWIDELKKTVTDAGGIYGGLQKIDRYEDQVVITEPTSKSTTYMKVSEVTPESVSAKLSEMKGKFSKTTISETQKEPLLQEARKYKDEHDYFNSMTGVAVKYNNKLYSSPKGTHIEVIEKYKIPHDKIQSEGFLDAKGNYTGDVFKHPTDIWELAVKEPAVTLEQLNSNPKLSQFVLKRIQIHTPEVVSRARELSGQKVNQQLKDSEDILMNKHYSPSRKVPTYPNHTETEPTIDKLTTPDPREFQNYMAKVIDSTKARRLLSKVYKYLGMPMISKERMPETGQYNPNKNVVYVWNDMRVSTIAHELGHVVDDNILDTKGKSLDKKFKNTDSQLTNTLEAEMNRVSWYIHPDIGVTPGENFMMGFKRGMLTEKYAKYRDSSNERFANFFTVYIYNPSKALELAPNAYKLFTNNILPLKKMTDVMGIIFGDNYEDVYEPPASILKRNVLIEYTHSLFQKETPDDGVTVDTGYKGLSKMDWLAIPYFKGITLKRAGQVINTVINESYFGANNIEALMLKQIKMDAFNKLTPGGRERISFLLYYGNNPKIQQWFSYTDAMAYYHLTSEEAKVYISIVDSIQSALKYNGEIYRLNHKYYEIDPETGKPLLDKKAKLVIDNHIVDEFNKLQGYFPISRYGSHWIYGVSPEAKDVTTPSPSQKYFAPAANEREAIQIANTLKSNGYKSVSVYPATSPTVKEIILKYSKYISYSDIEHFLHATGMNTLENPGVNEIVKELRKRSMGQHMLERHYVPGYSKTPENAVLSLMDFISDTSRRLGRTTARIEGGKLLSQLSKDVSAGTADKKSLEYATIYYNNFLSAKGTEQATFRKIIYYYFLGLKSSFLLQNLTQPIVTLLPEISKYVNNPEVILSQSYADACKAVANSALHKPVLYNGNIRWDNMYKRAQREKVTSGGFSEEATGHIHPYRHKIESILSIMGIASETVNRTTSLFAGIRVGEKLGLEGEQLYEFARDTVIKTQHLYGAFNRPLFLERAGSLKGLASTAYIFKGFTFNYLHLFSQIMKSGNAGSRIRSITSLLALAGVNGLPFAGLLFWLYKHGKKDDLETEIRKLLHDMPKLADVIFEGLPTLARADVSRMIGLGDILMPDKEFGEQLFGAGYGMANRFRKGLELMGQGEYARASAYFAPSTLSNILTARIWHEEGGVRQVNGELIYSQTEYDEFLKMIGIQPLGVSKKYKERMAIAAVSEGNRGTRDKFYTQLSENSYGIISARQSGDKKKAEKLLDERKKIYDTIKLWNLTKPPHEKVILSRSTIQNRVKGMKPETAQRQYIKGLPIRERKEASKIMEGYK